MGLGSQTDPGYSWWDLLVTLWGVGTGTFAYVAQRPDRLSHRYGRTGRVLRSAPVGEGVTGHKEAGRAQSGPLQVGLIGTAYPPVLGGMEVYLRDLACALAHASYPVRVATRFVERRPPTMAAVHASVEPGRIYTEEGVDVHVLGPKRWERLALRPVHRLHFRPSTRGPALRLMKVAFRRSLDQALNGCDVLHYSGTGREMLGFAVAAMARRPRVLYS